MKESINQHQVIVAGAGDCLAQASWLYPTLCPTMKQTTRSGP
jgi:hypothetical protein